GERRPWSGANVRPGRFTNSTHADGVRRLQAHIAERCRRPLVTRGERTASPSIVAADPDRRSWLAEKLNLGLAEPDEVRRRDRNRPVDAENHDLLLLRYCCPWWCACVVS